MCEKLKIVIIGGGGYIGFHIGLSLKQRGHQVTLFDLNPPNPEWFPSSEDKRSCPLNFFQGSILCPQDVEAVLKENDATAVIHSASHGMSGIEQLPSYWNLTESVNVGGIATVLRACSSAGVSSLVYTSTFNVVFGGQEIINGDETLPYFPLHRHVDHYSRTKAIGEQLVLMADGKGSLRTTALRLAGVLGVQEKRHLPRIADSVRFLKFVYGKGNVMAKVQFVSIENVVQAHVKALEALAKKPEKIGGEAYFISDGEPVENFEYFRPLIEGLGYSFPTLTVPMFLIWAMVYILQFLAFLVQMICPSMLFVPFLCPCEIYKTSVTHYFSNEKAQKDFNYVPQNPNDLSQIVKYYKDKQNNS